MPADARCFCRPRHLIVSGRAAMRKLGLTTQHSTLKPESREEPTQHMRPAPPPACCLDLCGHGASAGSSEARSVDDA